MTTQETNADAPQTFERNHAEAVLDVLFGVAVNNLNARLYRRIDSAFSLVSVVGGSAAFLTAISSTPGVVTGAIGLAIAGLGYLEREVKPAAKAVLCQVQAERWGDLAARAADLELKELDREVRRLQATGPDTFDALDKTAYNDNVCSNGFPHYVLPTSRWERFVAALT